jgi:hypothetical protein
MHRNLIIFPLVPNIIVPTTTASHHDGPDDDEEQHHAQVAASANGQLPSEADKKKGIFGFGSKKKA